MTNFACSCLLAGLTAAPAVSLSQHPTRAQFPDAAPPAHGISRTAGLHLLDGHLRAGADSYKVRFARDGFELTPALGRAAPRNYPLTFRLESIGRGASVAPLSAPAPTFRDLRVEYDRGVAIERYDVGVDGIAQSFVFPSRLEGTGDLFVRGRLSTDMTVNRDGDGLRFELPGIGGLRMSGVTGIDGNGERVRGVIRYADGVLELSLPAAFVARAALPLTLDPLIGNVFRITPGSVEDEQAPYTAWEQTSAVFLVVWTRIFSATDIDVFGQLVNRAGLLVGNRILLEGTAAFAYEPQLATCDGRDAFVVVYTLNGDIHGRSVNALSGVVSTPAVVIAGGTASFQHHGCVSGAVGNNHVVCAWQSDGHVALQATRVVVNANLTLSVPGPVHTFATTATLSGPAVNPRMSKHDSGRGRHAIAFQREFTGGANSDVKVMIVDGTGLPIAPEAGSLDATNAEDELPEVDGDGTTWVVAWQRRIAANDHDICAMSVSFDAVTGQRLSNTPVVVIEGQRGDDEGFPSVTWTGNGCLIGWMDQIAPNTANWEAAVRSVDLFLCTGCEGTFALPGFNSLNATPFGASTAAPLGTGDDLLLVWESTNSAANFNGDIVAQRWRAADGDALQVVAACGNGGSNHATCARSPNASFRFRLQDAIPATPTVFVLSARRLDLPCGACLLVPDPTAGILLGLNTNTGGDAAIAVPIPVASPLVGAVLYTQWATVDLVTPACALLHVEMSTALRIVIES